MRSKSNKSRETEWMGASIAIGGVGLVFGSAMNNPGMGLVLGIAIGVGVGVNLNKRRPDQFDKSKTKREENDEPKGKI